MTNNQLARRIIKRLNAKGAQLFDGAIPVIENVLVESSGESVGKTLYDERAEFEVEVLAVSGAWAMVRRKGAMPFVERVKDLKVRE